MPVTSHSDRHNLSLLFDRVKKSVWEGGTSSRENADQVYTETRNFTACPLNGYTDQTVKDIIQGIENATLPPIKLGTLLSC